MAVGKYIRSGNQQHQLVHHNYNYIFCRTLVIIIFNDEQQ